MQWVIDKQPKFAQLGDLSVAVPLHVDYVGVISSMPKLCDIFLDLIIYNFTKLQQYRAFPIIKPA